MVLMERTKTVVLEIKPREVRGKVGVYVCMWFFIYLFIFLFIFLFYICVCVCINKICMFVCV